MLLFSLLITLLSQRSHAEECDTGNIKLYSYVVELAWANPYTYICDAVKTSANKYMDDCTLPNNMAEPAEAMIAQLEAAAPPSAKFPVPDLNQQTLKGGFVSAMDQVCKQVLKEIDLCVQANFPLGDCQVKWWGNYVKVISGLSSAAQLLQNADPCEKVASNEKEKCTPFATRNCQWQNYPYNACRTSSWELNSHEAVCNGDKDKTSYEDLGNNGMTEEMCGKDESHDFEGVLTEEEQKGDGLSSHCTWNYATSLCVPVSKWKNAAPSVGVIPTLLLSLIAAYKMF